MNKSVVLLSGGMDSAYALLCAKAETQVVECIYINYGQNASIERQLSKLIAERHLKVPWKEILMPLKPIVQSTIFNPDKEQVEHAGHAKWFVPGRNSLMLTVAAMRAYTLGADSVYSGICSTSANAYPDCTGDFLSIKQQELWLAFSPYTIELSAPALYLERWEVIREAYLRFGSSGLGLLRYHTHTGYQRSESLDWLKASHVDRATEYGWGRGHKDGTLDLAQEARKEAFWKFSQWASINAPEIEEGYFQ